MPKIYLSPSTQESNPYVTGSGSEEYQMNRIADAMEPYLYANAIRLAADKCGEILRQTVLPPVHPAHCRDSRTQ